MTTALRQRLIAGGILIWLTLQTVIPFVRKFDLPHFQYRFATFSWAMYSKPALHYEVSLYRLGPAGEREAIPEVKKFVRDHQSPEPMRFSGYYRTEAQIQDWYRRLVEAITCRKEDGLVYGVSIRWIKKLDPSLAAEWEFQMPAQKKS